LLLPDYFSTIRAMKTLFFLLSLTLSLTAHSGEFNPKTPLSELPDGARLRVNQDIELGTTTYGSEEAHHVVFDKGVTKTDIDVTSFSFPFYSWILLRTNTYSSIEMRTASGLFHNYSAFFLRAGTYCLNRKKSDFPVKNELGQDIDQDRLFFETCDSGEAAFVIYTNAGIGMTQKQDENHFKVGRFHHHAGKYLDLVRP